MSFFFSWYGRAGHCRRSAEAAIIFFSAVEACLCGTLFGLLFEETRVCGDSLIHTVLIIAATTFVIKRLISVYGVYAYFKEKCVPTVSTAVSSIDALSSAIGASSASGVSRTEKVLSTDAASRTDAVSGTDAVASTDEVFNSAQVSSTSEVSSNGPISLQAVSKWLFIYAPISFLFLAYCALGTFCFVTAIKLALPEPYSAQCANSSSESRFLLIALAATAPRWQ